MTTIELQREADGALLEVWPADRVEFDSAGQPGHLCHEDLLKLVGVMDESMETADMVVMRAGAGVDLEALRVYSVASCGWRVVAEYDGEEGAQLLCERAS